jgi:hypothetical protein
MYPALGTLLTKFYSICFPLENSASLPDEQLQKARAFQKRIQRIEVADGLPNVTIDEFLEQGFNNTFPLFNDFEVFNYLYETMYGLLLGYSRIFVFNRPSYYNEQRTLDYLLRWYIPTVPDICNEVYSKFSLLDDSTRLYRGWYIPNSGNPLEPFSNALAWAIKIDGRSVYQIAKDSHTRLNATHDSIKKRVARWLKGENLPSIHECISVLSIRRVPIKVRLILYLGIIISSFYSAFPESFDVKAALLTCNRFGKEQYHYANELFDPHEIVSIVEKLTQLLLRARKKDDLILNDLDQLLTENTEIVMKYDLTHFIETIRARYYLHTASDYQNAIVHYKVGFEAGKHRAGRFQKQLTNEYLHCLSVVGDRVTFKRAYYWMRMYENFFGDLITFEEKDFDEIFNQRKSSKDIMVYRFDGDGIAYQP